jgi:hypothetical protein
MRHLLTVAGSSDQSRALEDAFAQVRATLTEILTKEAQASVDGTIERLKVDLGQFELRGVDVEVTVRGFELASSGAPGPSAGTSRSKAARKRSATKKAARKTRDTVRRGRPDGPVRTRLLEVFATEDEPLRVDQLRARLVEGGVEATADNVHQQLRRLVQSGALERAGRGLYRKAAGPATAEVS